jgi:hypothetical protein
MPQPSSRWSSYNLRSVKRSFDVIANGAQNQVELDINTGWIPGLAGHRLPLGTFGE